MVYVALLYNLNFNAKKMHIVAESSLFLATQTYVVYRTRVCAHVLYVHERHGENRVYVHRCSTLCCVILRGGA